MTDFEFLFSVFGLLIGLTFIEVAIKFADAIDAHSRRPIGLLTPFLALFVMIDVAGYWLFAWSIRRAPSRPLANGVRGADGGADLLSLRVDDLSREAKANGRTSTSIIGHVSDW